MRVHDSQAYRKTDVTRERISLISELREIPLSFQTGVNLVNAAVVCASLGMFVIPYTSITKHTHKTLQAYNSFYSAAI